MNKYLIKLADHLDKKGLHKEADYVDVIIRKYSQDLTDDDNPFLEPWDTVSMNRKFPATGLRENEIEAKIQTMYDQYQKTGGLSTGVGFTNYPHLVAFMNKIQKYTNAQEDAFRLAKAKVEKAEKELLIANNYLSALLKE